MAPPKKEVLILPNGGSGPGGNSWWAKRATGCLERIRLSDEYPVHPENFYKPTKTGPNAMLVGSIVHRLIQEEQEALRGPLQTKPAIYDDYWEWEPPQDAQDEAWRIYQGWLKARKQWDVNETKGIELLLTAELAPDIHAAALVDRLVVDPDNVLCLEDLKTSARSGDNHSKGRTRLQLHLYTMVGWANGYDIQRIRVRQIIKTKEIKEELFTLDLPDPLREEWLVRYLQGARAREKAGSFGPCGDECDFCPFGVEFGNGLCTL